MKQNEHQLEEVKKYCDKLGVDKLVFKTMQISSLENALEYLPNNPKYRRYFLDDGQYFIQNKLKNHCFALWRTSVITWDGLVVPCCFDKDAKHTLGNLNENTFLNIWTSSEYQKFRKSVLVDRRQNSICTNCTEGLNINIFEIEQ